MRPDLAWRLAHIADAKEQRAFGDLGRARRDARRAEDDLDAWRREADEAEERALGTRQLSGVDVQMLFHSRSYARVEETARAAQVEQAHQAADRAGRRHRKRRRDTKVREMVAAVVEERHVKTLERREEDERDDLFAARWQRA